MLNTLGADRKWIAILCFLVALFSGVGQITAQSTGAMEKNEKLGDRGRELLIFVHDLEDVKTVPAEYDLQIVRTLKSDPRGIVVRPRRPNDKLAIILREDYRVRSVSINDVVENVPYWQPNDSFFSPFSLDGKEFIGQWHLQNEQGWSSINILPAWESDLTGKGVVIGIVDSGVDISHRDLKPNYDPVLSFDFGELDNDPSPCLTCGLKAAHGTAVAGIAAAKGGDGVGVTGVAPHARISGLRVKLFRKAELPCGEDCDTVDRYVDAILYQGPPLVMQIPGRANVSVIAPPLHRIDVKNHSYGPETPFQDRSAESEALSQSTEMGTMHVTAAGNFRDDMPHVAESTKLGYFNHPDLIVVTAVGNDRKHAKYANFGSNVFVSAPSRREEGPEAETGDPAILTSDIVGEAGFNNSLNSFPDVDYMSHAGGTSSAAPMVAGVLALLKQANPRMNTRMAKHLIARTSRKIDQDDQGSTGGWTTNDAGFSFNPNYGFGLIDAGALASFNGLSSLRVTKRRTFQTGEIQVGTQIPTCDPADRITPVIGPNADNGRTGVIRLLRCPEAGPITRTVDIFPSRGPSGILQPVEEVEVRIKLRHWFRRVLSIDIVSPWGTTSRILHPTFDPDLQGEFDPRNGDPVDWTFTTNAFWGERPSGTWSVVVGEARSPVGTGPADPRLRIWDSFQIKLNMGNLITRRFP